MIALHHRGRAADDFANLSGWHELPFLADHAHVVAVHRPTNRRKLVGMFVRGEHARAAALGHAIIFDQAAGPALQDLGLQLGRKRCRGGKFQCVMRQVEVAKIGHIENPPILHRHQHRMSRGMLFTELEKGACLKLWHQYDRAAGTKRGQKADQSRVRIKPCRDDRYGISAIAAEPTDMVPAHAMRLNDPLRRARGSRRVDDVERLIRADLDRLWRWAAGGQPAVERCVSRAGIERDALRGDQIGNRGKMIRNGFVGEQMGCIAVGNHRAQLCGRCRWRQRRNDSTGAERADEHRSIGNTARGADRNDTAGQHAVPQQPRADAIGQSIERLISDALAVADDRDVTLPGAGLQRK